MQTQIRWPHLWLVRCTVFTGTEGEEEYYVFIISAQNQKDAEKIAIEKVHKTRVLKAAYQKITITADIIRPTKENQLIFACRVNHPRHT